MELATYLLRHIATLVLASMIMCIVPTKNVVDRIAVEVNKLSISERARAYTNGVVRPATETYLTKA